MKQILKQVSLVLLGALLTFQYSCKSTEKEGPPEMDPEFKTYISAFTSGVIKRQSEIKIILADEIPEAARKEDLFSFDPNIRGSMAWQDNRTLVFIPSEPLPSGTTFDGSFHLGDLREVASNLKVFKFQFQTLPQFVDVSIEGFEPYDEKKLESNFLKGKTVTSDFLENEKVEKMFSATQDGDDLEIKWEHYQDRNEHNFYIHNVSRGKKKKEVKIVWDGDEADLDLEGEKVVDIPALGDFKLMEVKVVHQPTQYARLIFSDPLYPNQDLRGLVRIENLDINLKLIVSGNEIRVYPAQRLAGTYTFNIEEGVENIQNYQLPNKQIAEVKFEDIKPEVKISSRGTILPNSRGLIIPFEAVNLHSVDIRVIKIFENNIGHFLQVNNLNGDNQLKRVGRVVAVKNLNLTSEAKIDYGSWNKFYLDLAKLMEPDPGAIYRIEISFQRNYSTYNCPGEETNEGNLQETGSGKSRLEEEQKFWEYDYYGDYDPWYYEGYSYYDRDNPCKGAYYGRRRTVSTNILASNIGLTAKKGGGDNWNVFASDLLSADPASGVDVGLYNYQLQLIARGETNGEGRAVLKTEKKPFLAIAKRGKEKSYLRLDDGSALSLSTFNVGGQEVQEGLKGLMYGERGVWRPGDSIYLSLILENEAKPLPEVFPISLELFNPRGQLIASDVKTKNKDGFYVFKLHTDVHAPTGNWTAKAKAGGATFTKTLRIETVKPNRLKIKFDFGNEYISSAENKISADLNVQWLHGAPAGNLRAEIKASFSLASEMFPDYNGYYFFDPVREFNSREIEIFDGKVDASGNAVISKDLDVGNTAPGKLMANFKTRVFEESGDESVDRYSISYSPFKSYVGVAFPKTKERWGYLRLEQNQAMHIITLDEDGKKISRGDLKLQVYRLDWRWWWGGNRENLASYIGQTHHKPVIEETISTRDGKATYDLDIDKLKYGRYLVRVCDPQGGHCTGKIFYAGGYWWNQDKDPATASVLAFSSDKEKYTVGEKAKVTFPSSGEGRALVTIETGSRILRSFWVKPQGKQVDFDLEITGDMVPNSYIFISYMQPHSQSSNDLPVRMYGVIPIIVEDPGTHLEPVLTMPEEIRPESKLNVVVSEATGKPMTYTLAIVDEGLLGLTRHSAPDPHDHFYAREALGVKTWDIYDHIIGAYGGMIERVFSIGGGGGIKGQEGEKVKRFKPVVKFFGPYHIGAGEKQEHSFKMPMYIGQVRAMVVAGNTSKAYGKAEKSTYVRKPLMTLASLPRVVGPLEEVTLPVTVFAMDKSIKDVDVEVETGFGIDVVGSNKKKISFVQMGEQVVNFKLRVAEVKGASQVFVKVKSGKESASDKIDIAIRNPNPYITRVKHKVIAGGQKWDKTFSPVGIQGTNSGYLELSILPPMDLNNRLNYLIRFPHGCVEQTTSKALPQLFLADIMEVSKEQKNELDNNVIAAIDKLRGFQVSSGGFSYWPGEGNAGDWITSYVGHFLIEAETKGFNVPTGMRSRWVKYQKEAARNFDDGDKNRGDFIQAYRLFTLALANEPDPGAMNRLREKKDLSTPARWRLAAAYSISGKAEVARELIRNADMSIPDYRELSYTYGSGTRDRAMILETLVILKDEETAMLLARQLAEGLSRGSWYSTQTTGFTLLSMSKFLSLIGKGDNTIRVTIAMGNKKAVDFSSQKPVAKYDFNAEDSSYFSVTNNSTGPVYIRQILEGQPAIGKEGSHSQNLRIYVKYMNMNMQEINVSSLDQGTDFIASVTIDNPYNNSGLEELALTQIFPSGWEIINTRLDDTENIHNQDVPEYRDIRDDRVFTYFDLYRGKKKVFHVLLNAAYEGKFYLSAVNCQAMYDNTISASEAGKWVEVVKPGVQ